MKNNPLVKFWYLLVLIGGLFVVNFLALFVTIFFAFWVVLAFLFNNQTFDETIIKVCDGGQNPLARDSGQIMFVELSMIQINDFWWNWKYNT